jgi:hypothetical protein
MAVVVASVFFIMFLAVCAAVNEHIIEPRVAKARSQTPIVPSIF